MAERLYTTGEFAKKANVSVRTIRYYDKQGLLKPSKINDAGYRLYSDEEFAHLQKILTLKYLGFSLEEIQMIALNEKSNDFVKSSLKMQEKLVRSKIEGLQLVEKALVETSRILEEENAVDWKAILHLIHMIGMEKSLAEQYKTGANTSVRIRLHRDFGVNPEGWFPWLFRQLELQEEQSVLEIGCGNGEFWMVNAAKIPMGSQILLSDISSGMIEDAKEKLAAYSVFSYEVFDCHSIPLEAETFDRVVANHVMFYLKNMDMALREIGRVLKPDGLFLCSTYGNRHMKEISEMVKEFDERINLSEVSLSEMFGLENGGEILKKYFRDVRCVHYEDELMISKTGPILDYIMSCHGNQQEYLGNRYDEFRVFLEQKMKKKGLLHITKDAGAFLCREPILK
ncbi:MAG: MerR family transcriptional regulator [bacterium]|nr:MerR family transcriptional regulator [bacterium]